ncbi:MAG: hypothetical protein E6J87_03345 [Deltaproteobacteria bacterium]|nr:MAG: hypothetical protein E6J87_03345 [Deltaproteobacteria bacterium]
MIATRRSAVRLAAAALALISIAAPAWSAPPKWDPKQVLALAERLAKALDEVEAAAREAPPQATALQQRKRDAALSGFHRVREAAHAYVSRLKAGWDRDMTAAYFRSVRDGVRDARASARDAVPSEQVDEKFRAADQALDELSSFYPDA